MFRARLILQSYPRFLSQYIRYLSKRSTYPPPSLTAALDTDTYLTQYGEIPVEKLAIKFTKSRGPGGQNVNKVNSRVQIRFSVTEADWLPEIVRNAIFEKHKNRLTKDGDLLLESQVSRSQHNNRRDAIIKLQEIIEKVYKEPGVPSEEKLKKIAELKEKAKEIRKSIKFHRKRRKVDYLE